MRTTVELTDEQRAQLLKLAAERGMKGFSTIVQEALDQYLEAHAAQRGRIAAALEVIGSFDDASGEALEAATKNLRSKWR